MDVPEEVRRVLDQIGYRAVPHRLVGVVDDCRLGPVAAEHPQRVVGVLGEAQEQTAGLCQFRDVCVLLGHRPDPVGHRRVVVTVLGVFEVALGTGVDGVGGEPRAAAVDVTDDRRTVPGQVREEVTDARLPEVLADEDAVDRGVGYAVADLARGRDVEDGGVVVAVGQRRRDALARAGRDAGREGRDPGTVPL